MKLVHWMTAGRADRAGGADEEVSHPEIQKPTHPGAHHPPTNALTLAQRHDERVGIRDIQEPVSNEWGERRGGSCQ